MQPRNIEVFDGLRITTEHFDHLQGSIHSALADLRGIAGLARVHRGFEVSRVDAHSVQVQPGLAFDHQGRRVVSDEPIKLETPASIATAPHFVCAAYDQGADGEVEGRPTRIWDSARVDIRTALPDVNDDSIVLAELRPAEGEEGFTVHPAPSAAAEPSTPSAPNEPPAAPQPVTQGARTVARLGVAALARAPVNADVMKRLASALRARSVAPGEGPVFTERLTAAEVHAGITLLAVGADATARVDLAILSPPAEGPTAVTMPDATWRLDTSGHGQGVVAADGSISQFGAGLSALSGPAGQGRCTAAGFTDTGILRCAVADAPRTNGDALLQSFIGGLGLTLRLAPRNGDGFAIDAILDWNGQASQELASWIERPGTGITCEARIGWTAWGDAVATSAPPTAPPIAAPAETGSGGSTPAVVPTNETAAGQPPNGGSPSESGEGASPAAGPAEPAPGGEG
ncbi:MAG: hypothetical protein ACT4P6_14135 [Gemmatimonadaceae bacterium]